MTISPSSIKEKCPCRAITLGSNKTDKLNTFVFIMLTDMFSFSLPSTNFLFNIWALLFNTARRNGHKPEFLLAEQNFPVPPSPLFRNDAAALPPRRFRRCTCNIILIKNIC